MYAPGAPSGDVFFFFFSEITDWALQEDCKIAKHKAAESALNILRVNFTLHLPVTGPITPDVSKQMAILVSTMKHSLIPLELLAPSNISDWKLVQYIALDFFHGNQTTRDKQSISVFVIKASHRRCNFLSCNHGHRQWWQGNPSAEPLCSPDRGVGEAHYADQDLNTDTQYNYKTTTHLHIITTIQHNYISQIHN